MSDEGEVMGEGREGSGGWWERGVEGDGGREERVYCEKDMHKEAYVQTYPRVPTLPTLVADGNPSCLQATLASTVPNESSHTVPHAPRK